MEILQTAYAAFRGAISWIFTQDIDFWALVLIIAHLLFHVCKAWAEQKERKRRERENAARRSQFVLPDRDNTFVQARLCTALQPTEKEQGEKREEFRFEYARKLLTKLKNAPLSTAERLQAEDLEKTLGLCLQKERLQADEIRLISDTFAAVLKLAAKYAV
jgi:hypothetical protein